MTEGRPDETVDGDDTDGEPTGSNPAADHRSNGSPPEDDSTREDVELSTDSPVETKGSSDGSTPLTDGLDDRADGFSGDVDLDDLDLDADGDADEASRGLFDDLLEGEPIFGNKEVLRPSYTPERLPHREEQINNMATILVSALRGETPSNFALAVLPVPVFP